jgi:hypothetical protein
MAKPKNVNQILSITDHASPRKQQLLLRFLSRTKDSVDAAATITFCDKVQPDLQPYCAALRPQRPSARSRRRNAIIRQSASPVDSSLRGIHHRTRFARAKGCSVRSSAAATLRNCSSAASRFSMISAASTAGAMRRGAVRSGVLRRTSWDERDGDAHRVHRVRRGDGALYRDGARHSGCAPPGDRPLNCAQPPGGRRTMPRGAGEVPKFVGVQQIEMA